jgi:hypothetical protein
MPEIEKFKVIALNISSSGDNTVIAAPSSGPINVWKMCVTAAGAVNFIFKNGSTAQSGAYVMAGAGSSLTFLYDGSPWSWADPGNAWIINLSGSVGLTGQVFYTAGG